MKLWFQPVIHLLTAIHRILYSLNSYTLLVYAVSQYCIDTAVGTVYMLLCVYTRVIQLSETTENIRHWQDFFFFKFVDSIYFLNSSFGVGIHLLVHCACSDCEQVFSFVKQKFTVSSCIIIRPMKGASLIC